MELKIFSVPQLLLFHAKLLEELRSRGVLRTANNPTGDLAEYLFCKAFGWTQAANSEKSYDALDADGRRWNPVASVLRRSCSLQGCSASPLSSAISLSSFSLPL